MAAGHAAQILIATVKETLAELWHFAIMFLLVFTSFAFAATNVFGDKEDFADVRKGNPIPSNAQTPKPKPTT
jgi:hypothetical protein